MDNLIICACCHKTTIHAAPMTPQVAEIMARWYPVQIHRLGEEDGAPYYFGFLIDWGHSACSATGDTVEEMLANLESVKRNVIEYYLEAGKPIPEPSGDPTESKERPRTFVRCPVCDTTCSLGYGPLSGDIPCTTCSDSDLPGYIEQ
jgi:predicted RNase H-like HicB family nuclease